MAKEPRKYPSANAFRRALEDRLKQLAEADSLEFQNLIRATAFDRFLARLFALPDAPWVLKGGYALELRIKEARATRDIDLALREALGKDPGMPLNDAIFAALVTAAATDLEDFFSFTVAPATMDLAGAPYGGARFPVEARLDGRTFAKFHLDVGAGDVVFDPIETTVGHDWLKFAGIPAAEFPTISREQHFAEKIHAYTLPRGAPNMRVRDLVDMVLLIRMGLDAGKTAAALSATFKRRNTHPVPKKLGPPPATWAARFAAIAKECGLSPQIDAAYEETERYYASL